jgi:hypothetical protein
MGTVAIAVDEAGHRFMSVDGWTENTDLVVMRFGRTGTIWPSKGCHVVFALDRSSVASSRPGSWVLRYVLTPTSAPSSVNAPVYDYLSDSVTIIRRGTKTSERFTRVGHPHSW